MVNFLKAFLFFELLMLIALVTKVLAISGAVQISVGVIEPEYHSYTKALNQRQDYYIECSGINLINITPIGSPIFLDNFTGGLCL